MKHSSLRLWLLGAVALLLAGYYGLTLHRGAATPTVEQRSLARSAFRPEWDEAALARLNAADVERPAGAAPNVIFIVLDTTRADHMSHAGYARETTPNIDRLGKDGVTYRQAHSVAPWTLPSHMSMFTGLYPGQHGATYAAYDDPASKSMEDILSRRFRVGEPSRLLAVQLQEMGYTTIGLSANTWVSERTGLAAGFQTFFQMSREHPMIAKRYPYLPREVRLSWDEDHGAAGLEMVRFMEHALSLGGDLPEPFFVFFNFIDPHYVYRPPPAWRYVYDPDRTIEGRFVHELSLVAGERPFDLQKLVPYYDSELNYLDFMVGRLLAWLRLKGYYDDALIVVTSDHGEHLGERGLFSHQLSVEEELLRVPLIVKYPGFAQAGGAVENPLVSNLDVYETILSAARGDQPPRYETVSRNLADMAAFDRRHLLAEYYYSDAFLRQLVARNPDFDVEAHRMVRRVVFDDKSRYLFLDPPPAPASNEPVAVGRERAKEFLVRYLAALSGPAIDVDREPVDRETIEGLRALGYVQ